MASYAFMKVLESSAQRYDIGINILSLGYSNKIKRAIAENYITVGDKTLDIGCGTGTLAILCAEKGALMTGLDISPHMLDIAREKIQERGLADRIQLIEMSTTEMDKAFNDETFDKIVGTLVFSELYPDEQKYALAEAYRTLKKGGLIIIADEIKPDSLAKRVFQSLVRIPLVMITYIVTQTSTKALKDVNSLLTDAGFRIIYQERTFLDSFGLYVARKE